MKTISGKVVSSRPISLSKAAKFLTTFVSAETEASHAVSAFLRRTSAAFNELNQLHRQLRGSGSERKPKKHRSHKLNSGEEEEGGGGGGSRDPGPASDTNPVVDLGRENSIGFGESGSVRGKGKKESKRNEGGEFAEEEEGSRDPGPNSDAIPNVDSGRENSVGFGENGSVRKKEKMKKNEGVESGNVSGKLGEIEEGEKSVGIEVVKKKNKKNEREKSGNFSEKPRETEDNKREGEESVEIEVGKKSKKKYEGETSGKFGEKRVELEDKGREGEENVATEVGKKKKRKNEAEKPGNFGEKQGKIEDGKRGGEESVGIEAGKKKKRKTSEAEGVRNDVSEEGRSSKKRRR